MRHDYNDPEFLRFMNENMLKVQEKRLQWFTKHKDLICKRAQFPENYKDIRTSDVAKTNLNIYLPAFAEDHRNSMVRRRKKPIRDGKVSLKHESLSTNDLKDAVSSSVMLPVDPDVENIHKIRVPYGGRKQYLKARNQLKPEDKYYFNETSNSVYGWQLKESLLPRSYPKFGRFDVFEHDLTSHTGIHPDPSHHTPQSRNPFTRC